MGGERLTTETLHTQGQRHRWIPWSEWQGGELEARIGESARGPFALKKLHAWKRLGRVTNRFMGRFREQMVSEVS